MKAKLASGSVNQHISVIVEWQLKHFPAQDWEALLLLKSALIMGDKTSDVVFDFPTAISPRVACR